MSHKRSVQQTAPYEIEQDSIKGDHDGSARTHHHMGHAHRSRADNGREGLVRAGQNVVGWPRGMTARLATLNAHWDARRETVRSFRADAAIDMVPPAHMDSTARALCELSL